MHQVHVASMLNDLLIVLFLFQHMFDKLEYVLINNVQQSVTSRLPMFRRLTSRTSDARLSWGRSAG